MPAGLCWVKLTAEGREIVRRIEARRLAAVLADSFSSFTGGIGARYDRFTSDLGFVQLGCIVILLRRSS